MRMRAQKLMLKLIGTDHNDIVPYCNIGNTPPERAHIRVVGLYFPWFLDADAGNSDITKTFRPMLVIRCAWEWQHEYNRKEFELKSTSWKANIHPYIWRTPLHCALSIFEQIKRLLSVSDVFKIHIYMCELNWKCLEMTDRKSLLHQNPDTNLRFAK